MRVIWIFFRPIFSHLSFLIFQIFNSKLIFFNTLMHRTQLLLFQLLVQGLQLKFSIRSKRKHKLENLSSISLQIMKMLYKFQICFYAAHRQPISWNSWLYKIGSYVEALLTLPLKYLLNLFVPLVLAERVQLQPLSFSQCIQ